VFYIKIKTMNIFQEINTYYFSYTNTSDTGQFLLCDLTEFSLCLDHFSPTPPSVHTGNMSCLPPTPKALHKHGTPQRWATLQSKFYYKGWASMKPKPHLSLLLLLAFLKSLAPTSSDFLVYFCLHIACFLIP